MRKEKRKPQCRRIKSQMSSETDQIPLKPVVPRLSSPVKKENVAPLRWLAVLQRPLYEKAEAIIQKAKVKPHCKEIDLRGG